MKLLMVTGYGGSGDSHWQTWLEQQGLPSERVQQQWHQPVLQQWRDQILAALRNQTEPTILVAHSFGCLATVAALAAAPQLATKVQRVILVAPAEPNRFSASGCRQGNQFGIADLLPQGRIHPALEIWASENDPWLAFDRAVFWANLWGAKLTNLGRAGHVNVASGFGAWPALLNAIQTPDRSALQPPPRDMCGRLYQYA
ncbi:MAG: alpha/beta fold hydrolase [Moraxellaceae bacterium]